MVGSSAHDLVPLLSHPKAHVFVCGSSNMAQEVASAFSRVGGPLLVLITQTMNDIADHIADWCPVTRWVPTIAVALPLLHCPMPQSVLCLLGSEKGMDAVSVGCAWGRAGLTAPPMF